MREDDHSRLLLVVLTAAVIVGTAGYFSGVSDEAVPQGYSAPLRLESSDDIMTAPTQAELAASVHGPNRTRFTAALAELAQDRRSGTDEVRRPGDAEWDDAVARRGERRAFDSAPPLVPHAIEQRRLPACVTCHAEGIVIEGRTAPAMSHEPMANCTQCHVPTESPAPAALLADGPPPGAAGAGENTFTGVARSGRGERAWAGAPPLAPHSTHMRERCGSCHGVLATSLRTTHAWRQSCLQCHGAAASLDQQPSTVPPPLPVADLSQ